MSVQILRKQSYQVLPWGLGKLHNVIHSKAFFFFFCTNVSPAPTDLFFSGLLLREPPVFLLYALHLSPSLCSFHGGTIPLVLLSSSSTGSSFSLCHLSLRQQLFPQRLPSCPLFLPSRFVSHSKELEFSVSLLHGQNLVFVIMVAIG